MTGWEEITEIDPKYIIKEFYEIEQNITFNYYEKKELHRLYCLFKRKQHSF